MTTVALAIISHDRPSELVDALRSAHDQTWDEIWVIDMGSTPPLRPMSGVTWLRFDRNLGYCAGRNHVAAHTSCDVVTFLDDDAVFLTNGAADVIRSRFEAPSLGALAARIERPGGLLSPVEFPFRGGIAEPDRGRQCAYFVGACHAVRVALWRTIGGLDERFFFSTEEIDFSLEVLKRGATIEYEPRIRVEHRPSPRGRVMPGDLPAMLLRNRIIMARRHLPAAAAVCFVGAWSVRTLIDAVRLAGVRRWLGAWKAGLTASIHRDAISWRLVREVHTLGGRALW